MIILKITPELSIDLAKKCEKLPRQKVASDCGIVNNFLW